MKLWSIVTIVLISGASAYAQSPYALDARREGLLYGAGCALAIGGVIAHHNISPLTFDQARALDRVDVNGFDRGAIKPYRETVAADVVVGLSVCLPLTFLANRQIRNDWRTIGVMWGETVLLQSGVNALVKGIVRRARPYAYDEDTPLNRKTTVDARSSFYSGHTGTAAAMSFFTARVFSDYVENRRTRFFLWSGAVILPAVVGALRVESGDHFPSDVIVGYIAGAAIGYFTPQLHKAKTPPRLSLEPSQRDGHPVVQMSFRF